MVKSGNEGLPSASRVKPPMPARFFGHTKPGSPDQADWEPLEDHLGNVAARARDFGSAFGAADWAYLGGLWHDLGKYRSSFQRYLECVGGALGDDGCEEGAPGRVDHSTVGAIMSRESLGPPGIILSYLIAGHHAGLPDASGGEASLAARLDKRAVLVDWHREKIPRTIIEQPIPASRPPSKDPADVHLWIRMLFSCLTDADFLATEEFMNPGIAEQRMATYPDLAALKSRFEAHMSRQFPASTSGINGLRHEVRSACVRGAGLEPGLFSLSVPTGGGKTLASMAFALHHAQQWKKRRIIYVIPYTSIVEQTADVFREIFGDAVIEHHSNIDSDDPARDNVKRRLLAENWDAPIIVTTNVQFFESLFAARPSRCRKLHNIVKSVVILDEAQLLPPEFLDPIKRTALALAHDYGVTIVISTATQPALDVPGIRELAPDPPALAKRLQRVRYEWPKSSQRRSLEDLAVELREQPQVLCVVGRRDDARDLFELMDDPGGEALHLSALMCGEHRAQRIGLIRARLKQGSRVRVVSTQLVEAGVDFDFPVVYRAFAGLDSIAQAAGRCNREGRLAELGRVVVFNPPREAPQGLLRKAESVTRELLYDVQNPVLDQPLFEKFFKLYYSKLNSLDAKGIVRLLTADGRAHGHIDLQFREAASLFKLVDDSNYVSVAVPWGNRGRALVDTLTSGFDRFSMRRLQRFVVNLPRHQASALARDGSIREVLPGLFAVANDRQYSDKIGLRTTGPEYEPGDFIS